MTDLSCSAPREIFINGTFTQCNIYKCQIDLETTHPLVVDFQPMCTLGKFLGHSASIQIVLDLLYVFASLKQ